MDNSQFFLTISKDKGIVNKKESFKINDLKKIKKESFKISGLENKKNKKKESFKINDLQKIIFLTMPLSFDIL